MAEIKRPISRAQAELDALRARYFDLYDLAPVGYCTLSEEDLILEANLMASTLLGAARDALVKQPFTRFILKEDQDIYYLHRKQLLKTTSTSSGPLGESHACELRMAKKDGTRFWAHLDATAVHDAEGAPVCRVALSDITERKQAEAGLKAAYVKLEMLWDVASLADAEVKTISEHILVSIVRMSGSQYGFYGFVNDDESVMTIHAWSGEAMKDCSMVDKPQQFPVCNAGVWGEAIRRRAPLILNDYAAAHAGKKGLPEGHVALTNLMVVPFFARGRILAVAAMGNRTADFGQEDVNQITAFLGSVQAVVDRKRAERALWLKNLVFDESLAASSVADLDGVITEANAAFLRIWGYRSKAEVVGKPIPHFFNDPNEAAAIVTALNRTGQWEGDFTAKRRDASTFTAHSLATAVRDENGKMIGYQSAVMDITERKRAEAEKEKLEAQNRQLQKSESLGRMAGAIAHHFNNQLMVVMGNLELAMEDLPQGEKPFAALTKAMQAGQRAAKVSTLMLTYLGQTPGRHALLDLSKTCRQHLPLLYAGMPKSMSLEVDIPAPGPAISANGKQIQHVLTNLITNALEAIGAGAGAIRLAVKTVSAADIPTVNLFPIDGQPHTNPYACLEVADTGCGIADQDIEKLFDPFYSSKFPGRGLGLAVVLGIVRAHEGVITVQSEPGHGSTFRIFLPLSMKAQADMATPATELEAAGLSACPAQAGMVLLVEDEEGVRKVAASMLTRLGFAVLVARDGAEALEVFRQRQADIRCVLCDLTMPRMDGWQTLAALRKLAPALPVILASGYHEAQVMAADHPERPNVFLAKPYRMTALKDAMARAMEEG